MYLNQKSAIFVLAVVLIISSAVPAFSASVLISVPDRSSHVFDVERQLLYISTSDGDVERYNVATQTLLTPFSSVGNILKGSDITPDNQYLYAADFQVGASQGFIRKVDLDTGAVSNIAYDRSGGEAGAWAIKIANNGKALFTTEYSGSGWTPLRTFNLDDEIAESRRSVRQRTKVSGGADRSLFYMTESNSSGGSTFTYDADSDDFPHSKGLGTSLSSYLSAVNRDGTLIATEYGGITIMDEELNTIEVLGNLYGGMIFDPLRDVIYAVDTQSDEVVAIETNNFQEIFRIAIDESVSSSSHFGNGEMSISPDGRYLFLSTGSGVRMFDLYGVSSDAIVGLEIAGPEVVDEFTTSQYIITAVYYDFHTEVVTDQSVLSVLPGDFASIDTTGLLTVDNVDLPQYVTIGAQFTHGSMSISNELDVLCYPIITEYFVDVVNGSDEDNGFTPGTAFATIQKGIDVAEADDKVSVLPGNYEESIDFRGKSITVQGYQGAPVLVAPDDFAVLFYQDEGQSSVLKNFIIHDSYMAVFIAGSSPLIQNVTIVNNDYGVGAHAGSDPVIRSSIFWNNNMIDLYQCQVDHSFVQDDEPQTDPLFADPTNGDYHLLSTRGRYVAEHGLWAFDGTSSPLIDAGDPSVNPDCESMPHGGRINMGAYGGTGQASKSDWTIIGDINQDGSVDLSDFAYMADNWLYVAEWVD